MTRCVSDFQWKLTDSNVGTPRGNVGTSRARKPKSRQFRRPPTLMLGPPEWLSAYGVKIELVSWRLTNSPTLPQAPPILLSLLGQHHDLDHIQPKRFAKSPPSRTTFRSPIPRFSPALSPPDQLPLLASCSERLTRCGGCDS